MSPEFEAAFLRYAALAFEKQIVLSEAIGERSWEFNADSGQLTFLPQEAGEQPIAYAVQILGSASQQSSTWRWGWANESVPEELATASLLLSEHSPIGEFQEAQFPIDLSQSDEHRVTMTCVGLLSSLSLADAYYRGPYEGGAAFFILRDARLQLGPPDAIRISRIFPQLISSLAVSDHRAALLGYLEARQLQGHSEGPTISVQVGNSSLKAQFDPLNRLADLQLTARPS